MDNKDYALALALKKQEFIRRIMDEISLDTLDSWYDMYEEARYVASLNSDEPELKEFLTNYEASFGHWSRQKEIEAL
ncbi:MAG: hypothetical protein K6G92_07230 [Bacteroidaceae bacterium]|nr:hypothetical protein [Bacteroidaceae bacterium]